jgi:hypothetical protein
MNNLIEIYNQQPESLKSDKGTTHCYISEIYHILFEEYRIGSDILEIGVQEGYSIDLWSKYFIDSHIIGLELDASKVKIPMIGDNYQILVCDAYQASTLDFLDQKFDIIIDDGPHTLESQIFTLENYSKLLKPNGILIIEDVNGDYNINKLKEVDNSLLCYDFRNVSNRFDDIVLIHKLSGKTHAL